jgi:hypothetical protein
MVVVVPPFPESKEADPPIVSRLITRAILLPAPQMCGRVDEPCHVVQQGCEEEAPAQPGEAADGINKPKVEQQMLSISLVRVPVESLLA